MTLPFPINPSQTDAKSPVDDNLMDSIREDLDYLDEQQINSGVSVNSFNVMGQLYYIKNGVMKRVDNQLLADARRFNKCRLAQRVCYLGTTEIDIRYHTIMDTPITGIRAQLYENISGIALASAALNTQSVSKATPQISTQSITRAKAALTVTSIIQEEDGQWRYNLSAAPDADWRFFYSVLIAGCTAGGNNGTFLISNTNKDGHPCIIVSNGSGVAQTGTAGTVELQLFSYNQTNPVSSFFTTSVILAAHTTGANNGTLPIHSINTGGNNIWVANNAGATQAGVAGTCDSIQWSYNLSSAANAHFVVGETARLAFHTSGGNNLSAALIVAVNRSGNNVIVENPTGVVQVGVAGTINHWRFRITLGINPATKISVGDMVATSGTLGGTLDKLSLEVKQVNESTSDNIIVFWSDAPGFTGGAVGKVTSHLKVVSFASDKSADITLGSYIEIENSPNANYNAHDYTLPFEVMEVNRGGGANYNAVIEIALADNEVVSPSGRISVVGKSIFTSGNRPKLVGENIGSNAFAFFSAPGIVETELGDIITDIIPENTYIGLYILRVQAVGKDLTVTLY